MLFHRSSLTLMLSYWVAHFHSHKTASTWLLKVSFAHSMGDSQCLKLWFTAMAIPWYSVTLHIIYKNIAHTWWLQKFKNAKDLLQNEFRQKFTPLMYMHLLTLSVTANIRVSKLKANCEARHTTRNLRVWAFIISPKKSENWFTQA